MKTFNIWIYMERIHVADGPAGCIYFPRTLSDSYYNIKYIGVRAIEMTSPGGWPRRRGEPRVRGPGLGVDAKVIGTSRPSVPLGRPGYTT